jgi:hypothetical protein
MRAGQNPIAGVGNKAIVADCATVDSPVGLRSIFIPVLRAEVVSPQIGEAARVGCQLV